MNRTDSRIRPLQYPSLQPSAGPGSMTIDHIIIHDDRLEACFQPHGRTQLYVVNDSTPLARISEIVRTSARSSGRAAATPANALTANRRFIRPTQRSIAVLSLYAHGAEVLEDNRGRDTALQMGHECLHSDNAQQFGMSIRGSIAEKIRVLGCAMAATENGQRICSRLAVGAQIPVFASSSVQLVYSDGTTNNRTGVTTYRSSRFGRWLGTVYEFHRDGTHRVAWRNGDDIARSADGDEAPDQPVENERLECLPNRNVHHL